MRKAVRNFIFILFDLFHRKQVGMILFYSPNRFSVRANLFVKLKVALKYFMRRNLIFTFFAEVYLAKILKSLIRECLSSKIVIFQHFLNFLKTSFIREILSREILRLFQFAKCYPKSFEINYFP